MQYPLIELLDLLVDCLCDLIQTVAHLRIKLRHLPLEPLVVPRRPDHHLPKLFNLILRRLICLIDLLVCISRLLNALFLLFDKRFHCLECLGGSGRFLFEGVTDVSVVFVE